MPAVKLFDFTQDIACYALLLCTFLACIDFIKLEMVKKKKTFIHSVSLPDFYFLTDRDHQKSTSAQKSEVKGFSKEVNNALFLSASITIIRFVRAYMTRKN